MPRNRYRTAYRTIYRTAVNGQNASPDRSRPLKVDGSLTMISIILDIQVRPSRKALFPQLILQSTERRILCPMVAVGFLVRTPPGYGSPWKQYSRATTSSESGCECDVRLLSCVKQTVSPASAISSPVHSPKGQHDGVCCEHVSESISHDSAAVEETNLFFLDETVARHISA